MPLAEGLGRIAAATVRAPFALPGFANSAMDGYAVRIADLSVDGPTRLPVRDQILAGDVRPRTLPAASAMAIMTGATMPEGADTVVIHERCQVADGEVLVPAGVKAGANVRPADDDCAAGHTLIRRAVWTRHLSLLAAFGRRSITPHPAPVAVLPDRR